MNITNDIFYTGVDDHQLDLFEGQYTVPNGMAYNSYVILDEKTAVLDTVEAHFGEEWLAKVNAALGGRAPDYLIIQHMEPDHSANILSFVSAYPQVTLVGNARTFAMLDCYYHLPEGVRRLTVTDGQTLSLGIHILTFLLAPMVHWPEVMVTYDAQDKVLFSADAFGKFGTLDTEEPWTDEARRYYIGIVGKYGVQVQGLLKKLSCLELSAICPLHGPALTGELSRYIDLYDAWSSYRPEESGVLIAYTSVYGHTKQAAEQLAALLEEKGCPAILRDLARTDWSAAVADAFRFDRVVLATTTYNGDIFPCMKEFLQHLIERGFQNRRIGLIENGSWAPQAVRIMKSLLEKSKDLIWLEPTVKINAALSPESKSQLVALTDALCQN